MLTTLQYSVRHTPLGVAPAPTSYLQPVLEALDRECDRAHKDLLRAEAITNEEIHRIMRNKVHGEWV